MTRSDYLKEAETCVCTDRNNQYGSPENSFARIAEYWSIYLDKEIFAHDVAMMMALLKMARVDTGRFKEDSYIDAIGYIACAGEIGSRNNEE